MEQLARLLGGVDRVKIMRFFLHHIGEYYSSKDIVLKTKVSASGVRRELNQLSTIGFLERKKNISYKTIKKGRKTKRIPKENLCFKLNDNFPHNEALRDLLFDFENVDKKEVASRFRNIGRIKLFLMSGIFIGANDSRVDVLIVGESLKRQRAEKTFELLASEIGRDLSYSIMDQEEFDYRFRMYDKFVRDILDMPHQKVIDKLIKAPVDSPRQK